MPWSRKMTDTSYIKGISTSFTSIIKSFDLILWNIPVVSCFLLMN